MIFSQSLIIFQLNRRYALEEKPLEVDGNFSLEK
jgi:hypothetical protein